MRKSNNTEVQNFLDGIMMTDGEKYNCLMEMREIVFNVYPETEEKIMYGGIVFSSNAEMFGGLFVSKKHVSFEFSKGFLMKDLNNHLEGTGKYRRHLKIMNTADVLKKEVASFVKQAVQID